MRLSCEIPSYQAIFLAKICRQNESNSCAEIFSAEINCDEISAQNFSGVRYVVLKNWFASKSMQCEALIIKMWHLLRDHKILCHIM